jgi:antitoxin ParD1/3/4
MSSTRWPRDLQTFVDEMLANGAYADEGEMILHAMYLLRDAELDRRRKHEELRRDLMVGVEQLERGEGVPGEQVFDQLRKRLGGQGEPSP